MNQNDKDQLKKQIEELILKTEKNIESYREMSKPIGPENAIGRVSRMDAINNKSVMESALRTAEGKLDKLQRALSRIDKDSFGTCVDCGQSIAPKRLLYMPESMQCMRCAR